MIHKLQLLAPWPPISSLSGHRSLKPNGRYYSRHTTTFLSQQNINVRKMNIKDLQHVLDWAFKENWNPGLYEIEALYAADPDGYHLLEIDNKPVASLAYVRYSQEFAFLGLFIVAPQHRKQGYGKLLWDIVTSNLEESTAIGLNSVMEEVERYKKVGFKPAHTNTRWRGEAFNLSYSFPDINSNITIQEPNSLTPLINYDTRLFPVPRARFLTLWLTMPQSYVLAATENDEIRGYGVISKNTEGYKIAPLIADNQTIAERLFVALCQIVNEQDSVYMDTPNNNLDAVRLMQKFGFKKTFDTFRMYKGNMPSIDESKWFGLTSLEIG